MRCLFKKKKRKNEWILIPYTKQNSKQIKDLNVEVQLYKEKIEYDLCDFRLEKSS